MKEDRAKVPLRTILQNFLNHVENLDRPNDECYEREFQSLKLFSESLKGIKDFSCTEGEKECNKRKNRYKDILPFDYTRVILSGIAGVEGSDYVNANYIKGASGSLAYIASQGPLSHTTNDFWRMIVECEVQVIVMACNEEESGKHKCENYWVEFEGEEKQFGCATIRLIKASVVCPDFLVRTMQLKYKKGDKIIERTVCQFHYSTWPDHGVPPLVRPLLDMVRLVRDTQTSETLPVLIHCSAGCGRTGTICAIDYVWGLLRAGKLTEDFNLLKLVRDMRKQRIAMVQTKDQYILVHRAVKELFQEQLKMIDSHPYENIDLNGIPVLKEEPLYEYVGLDEEKIEKKDKDSSCSDEYKKLPPVKEYENFSPKLTCWTTFDCEKAACSSLLDSGSSTDSYCTRSSEKWPKSRTDADSTSSSSPSVSSLLQKPGIAKLRALFEKNYTRPTQQVARSHSLGAVRKPLSQQSSPAAPVALYKKLFATKEKTDAKPALPIKRSKSLKLVTNGKGNEERDYVNINEFRYKKNDQKLDEGAKKVIEDCFQYLKLSQDPGSEPVPVNTDINAIVGGIGVRERSNSFRKAVCRDIPDTSKRKDYEAIWLGKNQNIQQTTAANSQQIRAINRNVSRIHPEDKKCNAISSKPILHYGPPLAPPRSKRSYIKPIVNEVIRMQEPIYANAQASQIMKDAYHGAPGIDVDTVAASMRKPEFTSKPMSRAFVKIQSNFRNKITSPTKEGDGELTDGNGPLRTPRKSDIVVKATTPKQQQYL